MDRWIGKVAVVTGASAGIGAAITEELLLQGVIVVGLARRKEKIEELGKTLQNKRAKLYAVATDISKEDSILEAFKWIKKNVGPIHILINNAGIGRVTSLCDGSTKHWREIWDTNVLGLCIATREAIKDMRINNIDGHIVNINSIAGHPGGNYPFSNIYPASKFAVTALTETLRKELISIDSKIKTTSLSPSLTETEFFEARAVGSGETGLSEKLTQILKHSKSLNAKDISNAIIFVLATPPHVQISELTIRPVGDRV